MSYRKIHILSGIAVLFFTLLGQLANAQTACIQANPTEICVEPSPAINFTNCSSGQVSCFWDFGDGTGTNNTCAPSVSHNYLVSGAGTYQVILTVCDGPNLSGNCDNDTVMIKVYAMPIPAFGVSDTVVCAPTEVCFWDLSTPGDTAINNWLWAFGDGGTASGNDSACWTYSVPGIYPVTLQIVDENGCANTIQSTTIEVNEGPNAAFAVSPNLGGSPVIIGCNPGPDNPVFFTDNSTSPNSTITNWSWNFDDGNTSTSTNDSNIYINAGTYNVTLSVTDANGCVDSIVQALIVDDYQAGFTSTNITGTVVTGCNSLTVTFQDTTTSAAPMYQYYWDFDYDGLNFTIDTTTQTNTISWTYPSPGFYDVMLVAVNAYGCTDTAFTSAFVQIFPSPNVGFMADTMVACSQPFTVTFTDTTPGGDTTIWDFDNWLDPPGIYDFSNPDTITYGDSSVTHTYTANGCYNVSVITTDTNNCTDTLVIDNMICISLPVAEFFADTLMDTSDLQMPLTAKGCVPLKVHFLDQSVFDTTIISDSIVTWYWDFGDGYTIMGGDSTIPDSTNDCLTYCTYPNPTHIYTDTGSFVVTLAVTTSLGCSDTITMGETFMCQVFFEPCAVEVGMPPFADFTVNDTVGCHPLSVEFTDLSSGFANDWSWDFENDGTPDDNQQDPPFTYSSAAGYFSVNLTAIFNGCESIETIQDSMILVLEPKPVFSIQTFKEGIYSDDTHFCYEDSMCTGGWKIVIRDTSVGPDFWVWDMDDTNTTKLIDTLFYNNLDTLFTDADTANHPLDTIFFTAGDTSICDTTFFVIRPAETIFFPEDSTPPNPPIDTLHIIGDIMHWLGMPTSYQIQNNDTSVSLYEYYIVPIPDTLIDSAFYIYMSEILDITLADTANFGCATQITQSNDTTVNPAYTVITPYGSDTLYYSPYDSVTYDTTVSLYQPDTIVIITQDTLVSSSPTTIVIGSNTYNITWSYFDIDTVTCFVPADTNFFGIDTVPPDTTFPDTTFLPADTIFSGLCDTLYILPDIIVDPPDTVYTDSMLIAREFEYTYYTPGLKEIWLKTWKFCATCPDSLCIDSTKVDLAISKIDAEFTRNQLFGGDTAGCKPFSVMFEDITTTIFPQVQRTWDFGDGNILVSPLAPFHNAPIPPGTHPTPMYPGGSTSGSYLQVNHFYENPGTYEIKLIAMDQFLCLDSITYSIVVHDNPVPLFIADTTTGCAADILKDTLVVTFTDTVTTYPSRILYWKWNYGDGTPVDTTYIPVTTHQYSTCGLYGPSLTVVDEYGCQGTSGGPLIRTTCPVFNLTGTQSSICSDESANFIAVPTGGNTSTGPYTYYYDWCDSTAVVISPNPFQSHTFTVDTTTVFNVHLTVADENGCLTTDSFPITVEKPFADFYSLVADIDTTCPNIFSFHDSSSADVTGWQWDFGDGVGTSTIQNPTYTYLIPGEYDVSLIVTTANNCIDDTIKLKHIVVKGPILIDTSYIDTGTCAPYPVVFTAVGFNTDIFTWYFGDGNDTTFVMGADPANPDTDTVTFVYFYTQGGTFQPVLELQDPADIDGQRCPYSYGLPLITVPGPELGFFTNDRVCGPRAVSFIDTSLGTQDIDIYWWDFGDGYTISGFGTIPSGTNNGLTEGTYNEPIHYYADTGVYDVTFGAYIYGADTCRYEITKPQYITVFGLTLPGYQGCPPLFTSFDASTFTMDTALIPYNLDSLVWDFGDGSTATGYSVTHTYNSTGDSINITYYDVSIQFGPNCTFVSDSIVAVYPAPIAEFYIQPSISGLSVSIHLINQTIGGDSIFLWNYDDGNTGVSYPSSPDIAHAYVDTGTYNIELIAFNKVGCSDTITHPKHIEIKIPNVFNPNSDNPKNSVFYIGDFYQDSLDLADINLKLIVFNRWGQKVFESDNYQDCNPTNNALETCWDGHDQKGNELGTDTYFYVLNMNNQSVLSGYVMILRTN